MHSPWGLIVRAAGAGRRRHTVPPDVPQQPHDLGARMVCHLRTDAVRDGEAQSGVLRANLVVAPLLTQEAVAETAVEGIPPS
jgi:hypothetical protein